MASDTSTLRWSLRFYSCLIRRSNLEEDLASETGVGVCFYFLRRERLEHVSVARVHKQGAGEEAGK